jgi:hypothetical protein
MHIELRRRAVFISEESIEEWPPWHFRAAMRWLHETPAQSPDAQANFNTFISRKATQRHCAICGCTDDDGCLSGCVWVAPNLCSACEELQT